MIIYIFGSKAFKKSIHDVLEHSNVKFRLSDNDAIHELQTLDELKSAIEENSENIFLIDDQKIIKKNSLNNKLKFLKPKDGIEEEFLKEHGIGDMSVDSINDIGRHVIKKLEEEQELNELNDSDYDEHQEIQNSIIDIVDEAYEEDNKENENQFTNVFEQDSSDSLMNFDDSDLSGFEADDDDEFGSLMNLDFDENDNDDLSLDSSSSSNIMDLDFDEDDNDDELNLDSFTEVDSYTNSLDLNIDDETNKLNNLDFDADINSSESEEDDDILGYMNSLDLDIDSSDSKDDDSFMNLDFDEDEEDDEDALLKSLDIEIGSSDLSNEHDELEDIMKEEENSISDEELEELFGTSSFDKNEATSLDEISNDEFNVNNQDLKEEDFGIVVEEIENKGNVKMSDEFSELDSLNEAELLEALGDIGSNVVASTPAKVSATSSNVSTSKNDSNHIELNSGNANDIASLLSQLLANKTLEITIKIKD